MTQLSETRGGGWSGGAGLIGVGLYTAAQAARLTGIPARRISRWLRGHASSGGSDRRWSAPIWQPDLPEAEGTLGLSFLDLVELRFVVRCLDAGMSLRAMRSAMARAREVFGRNHPFATRRLDTDGRTIFVEVANALDQRRILDLLKSQSAFRRFVSPSFRDIEFGPEAALRWWPLSRERSIVVDPMRAFGQPIVVATGVPTATLAAAVKAEGSVEAAARWFETDVAAVRDAVAFERRLAA
jgi:uncharacterized protein (DUF433 family)